MTVMRSKLVVSMLLGIALACTFGCHSGGGPRQLLDKYFASAIKQDYAATYECYYDAYKAKVSKEDFIKHRKEASVLQSYQIASLTQNGDTAQADVVLTFAPSEKLHRDKPVSTTVKEDLIRQNSGWKIKVWQ
jgi:hypothetical protein